MARAVLIGAIVVVALLVGGLVVGRSGGSSPRATTTVEAEVNSSVVVPPTPVVVRPPEAVAVEVVAMTGDVARAGFISRRDLVESICTEDFGPRLADQTSDQLDDLLLEFAERGEDSAALSVVEQPVRVRTLSSTSARASVAVWSVLVVAAPGAATARTIWRTVTLGLELVDGRWLVDAWESTPGPTPMASPDVVVTPAEDVSERIDWSPVEVG